ncbi:MAG: CehA/McbA family metallohydrolase [Treponema sp.]|jgi:hypothetical protein|nr:CehA/McbA family metallohydrolase [Treponema sp.]
MIAWKCFEMHSHTRHSDGEFTPEELLRYARKFLYDGIALTDHNTMSGLDALGPEEERIPVLPGIEWTTYYGHMLVLGADTYVDWRSARPDTIDEYTGAIKRAGGLIGIAHPFNLGGPLCTGCHWDFQVKNWDNIDYIEVWSEPHPQRHFKNHLAFQWWTDLLNQGRRLAATAGWDWHGPAEPGQTLPSATWLGLREGDFRLAGLREALGAGRVLVSSGPFPDIRLLQGEKRLYPGDTLERGPFHLRVAVDDTKRRAIWDSFDIRTERLCLVHNGKPVKSVPAASPWEESFDLAPGWIRLEGYGSLKADQDQLLFFSSPYYLG